MFGTILQLMPQLALVLVPLIQSAGAASHLYELALSFDAGK